MPLRRQRTSREQRRSTRPMPRMVAHAGLRRVTPWGEAALGADAHRCVGIGVTRGMAETSCAFLRVSVILVHRGPPWGKAPRIRHGSYAEDIIPFCRASF